METADATSPAAGTSSVPAGGSSRLGRMALPVILFIYTICVFVPWNLSPPPDDVDASWNAVLHWAHVHHVDFGHELVFTYGPWGFVIVRYLPATFGWVVAAWTVLSAGFFYAVWKISRGLPSQAYAAAWLVLVITLAGTPLRQFQDVRLATVGWLLLVIHFYFDDGPWEPGKITLGAGLAWASLIKFSITFIAIPVVAVISLEQLLRRKIPSYLIVFVAAYLALWLIAGQSLWSLKPYLSHSLNVAGSYTEGAQLITADEEIDVSLYVLTAGLLLTVLAMLHPWYVYRRRTARRVIDEAVVRAPDHGGTIEHRKSLLGAAGLVGVLFLLFKTGYVRHDLHEIMATGSVTLIALAIGAAVWPRVRETMAKALIVVLCAGSFCLTWGSDEKTLGLSAPGLLLETVGEVPHSVVTAIGWAVGGSPIQDQYEKQRAPLPDKLRSEIVGTVDSYSAGQRMLVDNNLDYRPRPVFQSYLTFSSVLSRLNAEFLAGPNAPQTILFDSEPVDGHYPSQDDALSVPELLTRYDLIDASGNRLVLRKAGSPRSYSLISLGKSTESMAHWVPVPASDDPIWVTIEVRLTPWSKMMRAIYKIPAVVLAVTSATGRKMPFALERDSAEAGFLLSPRLGDRMSLASLYSTRWKEYLPEQQVTALAVTFEDFAAADYYENSYTIEFFALHYPHMDVDAVPGLTDYLDLERAFRQCSIVYSDGKVQMIPGDEGKPVLLAPAISQILLPMPAGTTGLKFSFGMLNSSFEGDNKTDGVEFRVYTVDKLQGANIRQTRIWSQALDPTNRPEDRGRHEAEITIPATAAAGVMLETVPGEQHLHSDSYWTDVLFH